MDTSLLGRLFSATRGAIWREKPRGMPPYRLRRLFILLWAIALLMSLPACAHNAQQPQRLVLSGNSRTDEMPVTFAYVDVGARNVALVGSFSRWGPQPMSRTDQAWTITVSLPAGRHAYGFLVDGKEWRPDPDAALFEENGFGGRNSILIVE